MKNIRQARYRSQAALVICSGRRGTIPVYEDAMCNGFELVYTDVWMPVGVKRLER